MYADVCKVPKTITKINRTEYIKLFKDKDIGSVVCPKMLASYEIIRYVRAMDNTTGGSVKTLYRIVDEKVEALEFAVTDSTECIGEPLQKSQPQGQYPSCLYNPHGKGHYPER